MAAEKCCSGSITLYCTTQASIYLFALVLGLYPVSDFFKLRWLATLDCTPPLLYHWLFSNCSKASGPEFVFKRADVCVSLHPSSFFFFFLFSHRVSCCQQSVCSVWRSYCTLQILFFPLSPLSWDRYCTWSFDLIYAFTVDCLRTFGEGRHACVQLGKALFCQVRSHISRIPRGWFISRPFWSLEPNGSVPSPAWNKSADTRLLPGMKR